MTEQSAAVTVSHPPAAILRAVNPLLRSYCALRSWFWTKSNDGVDLHRTQERATILNSGERHQIDHDLCALAGAARRLNFTFGASAEGLRDGKSATMHGELIEDPSTVADLSVRCAASYGVNRAQQTMGLNSAIRESPQPRSSRGQRRKIA